MYKRRPINYIVAYKSSKEYFPISLYITVPSIIGDKFYVESVDDIFSLVLNYCDPADDAVACKETLLDYQSYLEDRFNLTNNLISVLYDNEG